MTIEIWDKKLQELNKELAQWVWPNAQVYIPRHVPVEIRVRINNQTEVYDFFTKSLDLGFQLLIPPLSKEGWIISVGAYEHSGYWARRTWFTVDNPTTYNIDDDNSPSMALCKIIKEYLDIKKGALCK